MHDLSAIFDHRSDFDPAGDLEAFCKSVPGRWVVYLFTDAADQPIQLLCVRNLRASLKRRLGGNEVIGPTRKVNYRDVVRRVWWRRVDSAFEADWVYYEAARQIFPQSYRGMVGFRDAWFIHVDPDARFPRYTRTNDLSIPLGQLIGPIETKDAAGRLIELIEDAFDLCRYYNILTQSPHGKACAYKQMHRCPAPCDGSLEMEQFRRLYQWSVETLINPAEMIADQKRRMQQAAAELRFESAGKIKAYLEQLQQLCNGPYRHARLLADFAFVSLHRGPWERTAKVFLITPGQIDPLAGLIEHPADLSDLLHHIHQLAEYRKTSSVDELGAERVALVTQHLFQPRQSSLAFIPLALIDEKTLLRRYGELLKSKPQEPGDDEGIVRELQAM